MSKSKYAKLYTLRSDGRYQGSYTDDRGRHYVYDRDPEKLYYKLQKAQEPEAPPVLTFKQAEGEWEREKIEKVSYKTAEGYKSPLAKLNAAFGDVPVEEITPGMIQSFVNSLVSKGYKRSTVQRPLDVARMIFDDAVVRHSLRMINPCASVKLPRGLSQEARDLADPEQIEKVKAAVGLPFGLFAYAMMYTGLRDGELLALTDKDIGDEYINVSKSVSWQPNKPVIKEPKTAKGVRKVIILDPLRAVLPKFRGYLFSADGGKTPLTNTEFRRRWAAYCKAAGLSVPEVTEHTNKKTKHTYKRTKWVPQIVPYQLRHEYATLCYDAGLDMKDTQELMGHASEQTTQRIYTHIRQQRREVSAKKLNDFIVGVKNDVKNAESTENA